MRVPRSFAPFIITLLVAFVSALRPLGAAARPLAAEDLTRVRIAQSAVISHDGRTVAFTVMRLDAAKNTYVRNIWLVPAARRGS